MSELVDEHDLGSCAERRGSSSFLFPTRVFGIEPDDVSLRFWIVGAVEGARVHSRMRTVDVGVILYSPEWIMARPGSPRAMGEP